MFPLSNPQVHSLCPSQTLSWFVVRLTVNEGSHGPSLILEPGLVPNVPSVVLSTTMGHCTACKGFPGILIEFLFLSSFSSTNHGGPPWHVVCFTTHGGHCTRPFLSFSYLTLSFVSKPILHLYFLQNNTKHTS